MTQHSIVPFAQRRSNSQRLLRLLLPGFAFPRLLQLQTKHQHDLRPGDPRLALAYSEKSARRTAGQSFDKVASTGNDRLAPRCWTHSNSKSASPILLIWKRRVST